jgi:outer membrane protein OmpA-like peptidoglycan-associated protein
MYDGPVVRWVSVCVVALVLTAARVAGAVVITPSAASVDVGTVLVNDSVTDTTLTLTSDTQNYSVDFVISNCTGAAGTFVVTGPGNTATNSVLKSNSANTINVAYTPSARGLRQCRVDVYDNMSVTPSHANFVIRGTGVAPVVSAGNVTFGAIRYNNIVTPHTATQSLTITNTSTDTGQVLTINNLTSSNATEFAISGPTLPAKINPNSGTASWTITFDPTAAGPASSTITIDSDDPLTPMKTVAASGTGGTGVLNVTSALAFGTVAQGTTSSASNIVVSNVGSGTKAALGVTQAAFSNNTANWFRFANGTGCNGTSTCTLALSLIANTGTVPVVCQPPANASGTQMATIDFTSDADSEMNGTTTVSCTAGRADISVATTQLTFGNILINTTSTAQKVTIANTGNAQLSYSVALAGTNPGQFTLTGAAGCTTNCPVAAGSSVEVSVAFKPNNLGPKTALLRITPLNDPDTTTPIDVVLTGTCIGPVASLNTTSLAFNDVDVAATSTGQMVTMSNTGTADLTLTTAYLSADAANYTVTGVNGTLVGNSVSITVAPMSSVSWMVACKPTTTGAHNGTFLITSNTGNAPGTQHPVALTCNGVQGSLTITASSHDFGGVREGFPVTQTFTLKNTGNTAVSAINYTTSGTGTGYSITSPTFPISLAANATATVTVQFYPMNGNDGGSYTFTFAGTWGTMAKPTNNAILTVNGDGLTTGFDTYPSAPNPLDIGNVRFDLTGSAQIQLINTAGTQVTYKNLVITPGTAQTGELAVIGCYHNSVGAANVIPCPNGTASYASTGLNDKVIVVVQCDPANRVAMLDGSLKVSTDLQVNATRDVPLKCNANTAALAIDPTGMVVDFGPVDLDMVPVAKTKRVTITNAGTANMNIGTVTKGGSATYAFTATPTANVSPQGTYTFDVTYTPTVEKPMNQPDTGTVTIPLQGVFGSPASITIQVSGYGVDRHIALAPAPQFPDTYKNPGTKAPTLPVTITNNGDATLSVSAVMLTDDPIWTIVNPDPVDVPGRGSYDFDVKFSPITAGKAPTGHMAIYNNDNGKPVAMIDLDGIGLDRQVQFGPPVIDLGYVGIGLPVRLSDASQTLLDVTNSDVAAFDITRIGIDGGNGAFEIVDTATTPSDPTLAPRTTRSYDVVFTPNYEGDFQANASLYLDGADQPHATVVLRGRGLYVDVRGGGGCSTGRGNGGGMILLLGALLVARRRRLVGLLGLLGGVAHAETRNLDTVLFDPTPATHKSAFHTQTADVGDAGEYAVSALLSYVDDPLVLDTAQNDYRAVGTRTQLSLGVAYAFGGRFEAGVRMPFYFQGGDGTVDPREMFGVDAVNRSARGDGTLHVKMHLTDGAAGGLDVSHGFVGQLTVPTHSSDEFAGTNMPQGRLLWLTTLTGRRLQLTLNAGAIIRSKERYTSLVQRSGGAFGAGLSYRWRDKLWIGGEVFGNLIPGGKTGKPMEGEAYGAPALMAAIEGLGEIGYQAGRTTNIGFAVGRGITSGVGTSAYRGVLLLSYTPSAPELKPIHPPRPPEPPKDSDNDGVVDKLDACPDEAEDKDMFDDADGCPDLDNDRDGIADAKDKCPLDAEDNDRFEDEDGCPELDNDADGIADAQDKCPTTAEDKDGYQDTDGCSDPDNDGDGIVDTVDKCPREPESINGNNDDDGCPDRGDALVVVSPDRLELLGSIEFSGTKVSRSSHNLLGQVGATLRAHPEILRVRLTVHVQPTSNSKRDKGLSEARAKAVHDWLTDWGIDPLRMQAAGFGGTKPLVPANSRGAAEINNRLELIILERK